MDKFKSEASNYKHRNEIFDIGAIHTFVRLSAVFIFLGISKSSLCQDSLSRGDTLNFRSEVSVTNNGFSFNPAFSLGKPAAMLDMTIGWKRFSFEPQFRFSLKGKPWGFIFIYRYKVIAKKKFQFVLGTHMPGMPFREIETTTGGVTTKESAVHRYVVAEFIPTYWITPKITLGIYCNFSHGIEREAIQRGQLLSFRAAFSHIKLSKSFTLNFAPQLFYVKLDERKGYYFSSNISVSKNKFPISIGSTNLYAFRTDVPGEKYNWNVSVIYLFARKYAAQKS